MPPSTSHTPSIKFNFTLEPDVARSLKKIKKGKRSQWVNAVLKAFLKSNQKVQMIEGFKQNTEDFEAWENLGFETWNCTD